MKFNFKRVLAWLDANLFFVLSGFLLLFIPLYPKLPLADLIPGYIVRLRLEDIFVFITFILYLIWIFRGKISWKMPTWQLIFAYIAIGMMSILSGIWLLRTIPLEGFVHLGKSILHWARYIEYFFLAFLFYSSIKSRLQLKIILALMLFAVASISIYGLGQKYFYWPLYSTMNREFSKGIRLYLTEHARVQSTFGGHYDFAGYLVLLLPFTLILAWRAPKTWQKALIWLVHFLGVWGLILSASRTSIGAYAAAAVLLFTLNLAAKKQRLGRKIAAWFGQQLVYFTLVGVLVFCFGHDMIERFSQTIDSIEPLRNIYHGANKWRKELPYLLGWKDVAPPSDAVAVNLDELGNNIVLTPSDERPVATRPADVHVDVPIVTEQIDASGSVTSVEATRTWSVNAEKYGLSMAIRYDSLWPNAWHGMLRNPFLGSGYGTLNKGDSLDTFTEADSTDNNFLRTLGETGILGVITFYGLIVWTAYQAFRLATRVDDRLLNLINYAFICSSIGILINAVYIDVFAASKVAFTFWMLYGLFYACRRFTTN